MEIKISIPATSANIGPGYDILGLALQQYNTFRFTPSGLSVPTDDDTKSICHFTFSSFVKETTDEKLLHELTGSEDNLIIQSFNTTLEKLGIEKKRVVVSCHIDIPLSRGLGSSSTAILAGVLAANEFALAAGQTSLNADELFALAVELEGHPDNIAPAFYGGLILSLTDRKGRVVAQRLGFKAPLQIAGIVPHIDLSTKKARQVVPTQFDAETLAFQAARCSLLTHLLSLPELNNADLEKFALALDDKVHQNQRAEFIPGMTETFTWFRELGALGTYLSGAGTTLLAFWPAEFDFAGKDLGAAMKKAGTASTSVFPTIDNKGAKIEKFN